MLSIPEIASQSLEKSITQSRNSKSARTLFIVGSKFVGKTTLIYSLLERSENPKETLVLEYYFGRKTTQKQEMDKMICHIWEYGGKLDILKNVLASVPVNGHLYYCVMVDLSKIKNIWEVLETSLNSIKKMPLDNEKLEIVIICGKYDLFKNYDSEIKKFICTTLRSIALIFKAQVFTYSSKETSLVWKMKEIFNSMCFENEISAKDKNTNYTKPLTIPKGTDSWESIGIPSATFDQIKIRHMSRIPSDAPAPTDNLLGPKRTHPEPVIESLLSAKYDELYNMGSFDFPIEDYIMNLR